MKTTLLYPKTRMKKNDQHISIDQIYTPDNPLKNQLYQKIIYSFNMAKSMNLNHIFSSYYNESIPLKLNEVFRISAIYNKEVYTERGSSFIPMGTAFHSHLTIECNVFHLKHKNKTRHWTRLFWHELAHLIDANRISGPLIQSMVKRCSSRYKHLNPPNYMKVKQIVPYFYKPLTYKNKLYYHRLTDEVFAECFGSIMLLISEGINRTNIQFIMRLKGFCYVYHPILIFLMKNMNFKEMGIHISSKKKQNMIHLFEQMAQEEYRLYKRGNFK